MKALRDDALTRSIPVIAVTASVMSTQQNDVLDGRIRCAGVEAGEHHRSAAKDARLLDRRVGSVRVHMRDQGLVLVVDDQAPNRKLLADLLGAKGYAVADRESGAGGSGEGRARASPIWCCSMSSCRA